LVIYSAIARLQLAIKPLFLLNIFFALNLPTAIQAWPGICQLGEAEAFNLLNLKFMLRSWSLITQSFLEMTGVCDKLIVADEPMKS